ncbi:signal peptidase I [Sporolactobacillus sp. Y61]|jgi:signal peptidase I|uniref:Signal peptidase I n=1 Tax=Sporolactobacillus sp. Y61 TaxID=3160863 RepID=A0AAU8IF68_9BACL|nr:signal peptidase I [Sporolactobacillus sp. THM19-2]RYL94447.1 signal peptidase I [Sporolactobacillus sp. THM19-2]
MSKQKKRNEAWAWVRAIGIAILVVIIVRSFILGNYIVDGPSMMPTLYSGDRLIVNKINYKLSQPDRFDVVIFHATKKDDYVKRIIGLPGDTIKYANDQLYINNKPVNEPFLKTSKKELLSSQLTWDYTLEGLTGVAKVPSGKYWVMGDNRQNSVDSRIFGFVDQDQVVGKVDLRYWPMNRFGIIHSY